MKTFLEIVAEDIIAKFGDNLSRTAIVFPNKRSSLFMNEHLARMAGRPIWSPAYLTISDLFRQQSESMVGDDIKLVCDLHKSFVKFVGETEPLDRFYGWGQLLLTDFDDIDKNMADAQKVFANLRDLHELDDLSYLTEAQKAVLKKFFSNFTDDQPTKLKKKFIELWSKFGDIYADYRERLALQGLAYEGMLYRSVVESGKADFGYDRYIFVGFNLLQKVEQLLFKHLKEEGKAHFYWDFDHYYMKAKGTGRNTSSEAGHFISQYLELFPNELENDSDEIYNNLSKEKQIAYVSSPTENLQARYVSRWLREQNRIDDGRRTAIVLCDESLLPTVVHCLPTEVDKVNITTGYPLQDALVTSFVNQLFMLRIFGGRRHYKHVMRHPYAKWLAEGDTAKAETSSQLELLQHLSSIVKRIAQQQTNDGSSASVFNQEALFRMYTLLNRLANLVEAGDLDVDVITLQRFLLQLIQSTSIPFHGEPAEGIQVMGVLETRNLDFDHVLVLSCNEGNIPRNVSNASFIPYSLRKAFGLTTIDHKVSVYSYYFHSMLQRAKDVTLLYNNSTEDGHTGEMSRFMLQWLVESGHNIERFSLQAGKEQTKLMPKAVEKSREVIERLDEMAKKGVYPTFIYRYMRCQLQFYFNNVAGIKEPDADDEEMIDNRMFGNIFHRASQLIYAKIMSRGSQTIMPGDIENVEKQPQLIEQAVDQAMLEELNRNRKDGSQVATLEHINGLQLINREVILRYVKRLLHIDKQLAPFYIKGLECFVEDKMEVQTPNGLKAIRIGGIIDRLDMVSDKDSGEDVIRVVDYKTGAKTIERAIPDVESIFQQPFVPKQHPDYYLQTMLYACMVKTSKKYNDDDLPVAPALLFIQHAVGDDYDPVLMLGKQKMIDIEPFRAEFLTNISNLLAEMFDPTKSFVPTTDRSICATCPYKQFCGL
ncbi:MAG: PD-(D/E)XK nuclease family protein [Prevotella sp.]|nr:PD-(D/E)XK nuclease family protein [Prevotella sp.]